MTEKGLNCWMQILKYFPINKNLKQVVKTNDAQYITCVDKIKKLGIGHVVVTLSLESLWNSLRSECIPTFCNRLKQLSSELREFPTQHVHSFCTLQSAIRNLHDYILQFIPIIKRCEHLCELCNINLEEIIDCSLNLNSYLKLQLRSTLHSQLPAVAIRVVENICAAMFKVYCYQNGFLTKEELCKEDTDQCPACDFNATNCCCNEMKERFEAFNKDLRDLELLERISGSVVADLLFTAISDHITHVTRNSYDQHQISALEKWEEELVRMWLEYIYCGTQGQLQLAGQKIQDMVKKNTDDTFKSLLYHKYTLSRISQLFDIVIEFPDSSPALEDIKECIERTTLRKELVTSLKAAIQARLLHPGVNTIDILHAYIATIKALRLLDPKGILLELVSGPIRAYLRGRTDFVRYIVTSLTDDGSSELGEDLILGAAPLVLDDSLSDIEDFTNWDTWTPDPSLAQCNIKSKCQRTADIVSMLINIYGSKDIFITEYRTILADRILSKFSYETENEVRHLEHLKLRFGESIPLLHKCEVMVKDVTDSRRLNSSVRHDFSSENECNLNAMIVSTQFWPAFKSESVSIPPAVIEAMDKYTESFKTIKDNRTLSWKHHLGKVELEVEIGKRTLNFSVPPVLATIIYHFEKQKSWHLDDLARVTLVPKTSLRRKIAFWQAQGLIKLSSADVFTLVEDIENDESHIDPLEELFDGSDVDEEHDSVLASAQDQRQEELQVLWSYIVGMLTNLDSLPLDRMHSVLKLFAQGTVECTLESLKNFLHSKIAASELVYSAGSYRLPK